MKTVLFRADASAALGAGHWVRCGALAAELRALGVRTPLAACQPREGWSLTPPGALDLVRMGALPNDQIDDAQRFAALAKATGADTVVVDHYELDETWETEVKRACPGIRIVVIEDRPNRRHSASVVIAPSGTASGGEFLGRFAPGTHYLGGPAYALLRPEFAMTRPGSIACRRSSPQRCTSLNVLISMGATDPDGLSIEALAGARASGVAGAVTLVITSASPWLAHFRAVVADTPNSRLQVDVEDMAALMADSDIGIGTAGGTSWERCSVGLPSLAVQMAANQSEVASRLREFSAAIVIDDPRPSIAQYVQGLQTLANPPTRTAISQRAAEVCDGCGAKRVADKLLSTPT